MPSSPARMSEPAPVVTLTLPLPLLLA